MKMYILKQVSDKFPMNFFSAINFSGQRVISGDLNMLKELAKNYLSGLNYRKDQDIVGVEKPFKETCNDACHLSNVKSQAHLEVNQKPHHDNRCSLLPNEISNHLITTRKGNKPAKWNNNICNGSVSDFSTMSQSYEIGLLEDNLIENGYDIVVTTYELEGSSENLCNGWLHNSFDSLSSDQTDISSTLCNGDCEPKNTFNVHNSVLPNGHVPFKNTSIPAEVDTGMQVHGHNGSISQNDKCSPSSMSKPPSEVSHEHSSDSDSDNLPNGFLDTHKMGTCVSTCYDFQNSQSVDNESEFNVSTECITKNSSQSCDYNGRQLSHNLMPIIEVNNSVKFTPFKKVQKSAEELYEYQMPGNKVFEADDTSEPNQTIPTLQDFSVHTMTGVIPDNDSIVWDEVENSLHLDRGRIFSFD